nr:hypothetical protein [Klebsiella pneumoniae subsp. pneumoniae]
MAGRIGMSPQPTKTLQQHIGWRKTADEEISIYIEGLFQNLVPTKMRPHCLRWGQPARP